MTIGQKIQSLFFREEISIKEQKEKTARQRAAEVLEYLDQALDKQKPELKKQKKN